MVKYLYITWKHFHFHDGLTILTIIKQISKGINTPDIPNLSLSLVNSLRLNLFKKTDSKDVCIPKSGT